MNKLSFMPREPQGLRGLVGCHVWGHTESDTTEVLSSSSSSSSTPVSISLVMDSGSGPGWVLSQVQ